MADLIDRQAAIDAIQEDADWLAAQGSDWQVERMERDKSILQSLPSAQPDLSGYLYKLWKAAYERGKAEAQPERKTGRWYKGEAYPHHLYCSVCYRTALPNFEYMERWGLSMNYCPNCGARMGEQDE